MPDIDGFTLAEQIKRRPGAGRHGGDDAHLGRPARTTWPAASSWGSSAYLLKPVKQSELLEAIERALGMRAQQEDLAAAAAGPSVQRPLRILLAEDSVVNQKLAVALLEGQGHTVAVADNGREALAACWTQPSTWC